MSENPIRDYLYLDIDRVRSIYAQSEGGLIQSIIESENASTTTSRDAASLLGGEKIGKEALLGTGRVETRVVHDYLFTAIETKLKDIIVEVSNNTVERLEPGNLIKVTGTAEFDDTDRMRLFMEEFNDLYAHILAAPYSSVIDNKIKKLRKQQKTATSKDKKAIEAEINNLKPENIFDSLGVSGISPLLSKAINKLYGFFYDGIFEIKIVPTNSMTNVFRGILNRTYLRENSNMLHVKYGTRTKVNLTMVGQITTIFAPQIVGERDKILDRLEQMIGNGFTEESETQEELGSDVISTNNDVGNFRDAFESLFDAIPGIEEVIFVSQIRKGFVVTPLAIYHPITI